MNTVIICELAMLSSTVQHVFKLVLSLVVLIWARLPRPAIRSCHHFLVHFLSLLAMKTMNVNDNIIFKCVKLVQILLSFVLMWVCLPHPAIRPLFCSFFSTFPFIAGYWEYRCKWKNDIQLCQVSTNTIVILMWVCLPCPAIRTFIHFLVHFLFFIMTSNVNCCNDVY